MNTSVIMAEAAEPIPSRIFCQFGRIERQREPYRFFFGEITRSKRLDEQQSVAVTGMGFAARSPKERCPVEAREFSRKSKPSIGCEEHFKTAAAETSIYPEDSIVDATPDDPNHIFRRGPFEACDDDCYTYPYVLGLDYAEGIAGGKSYISINSWKGRIAYGIEDGSLLGAEILELAIRGGWDQGKYYAYHEVSCGGADVIPHYVTIRIAESLRKFLRNAPDTIESEGRAIRKNTLLWAVDILAAGPTTFPW
jgi:hypothetical protein